MKDKWGNYAIKTGKVESSYKREYCNRKKVRKAPEASDCNSTKQNRKGKEEIETSIQLYGKCVLLTEDVIYIGDQNEIVRKENPVETHQQGQQGVQVPAERRPGAEEEDLSKAKRKKVMKKEKDTAKHKKHEASETKAYEKKEDKKEKLEKSVKKK